jgi:hypothetical protein
MFAVSPHHSTVEEERAMNLVRFIGLLFVFIGVLASSTVAIALLVLMLRAWPLALAIGLALVVFHRLLQRVRLRVSL